VPTLTDAPGQKAGGSRAAVGGSRSDQPATPAGDPGQRPGAIGTPSDVFSLDQARRLGEVEAEVLDLTLKVQESLTRERRLLETVTELQEALEHNRRTEYELRGQIDRYAAFHRDLDRSWSWRALQFLRRLVGRRW
jgi:hypothetical protein